MKIQTEYQTNIDYQRTYEEVNRAFSVERNTKGILTIYVASGVVNISPNGKKVQITCSKPEEKENILRLIQRHFVPSSGNLWLKPYKAHFHTDWPPPPSFEFSACSPKCYCTCEDQRRKEESGDLEQMRDNSLERACIEEYKREMERRMERLRKEPRNGKTEWEERRSRELKNDFEESLKRVEQAINRSIAINPHRESVTKSALTVPSACSVNAS